METSRQGYDPVTFRAGMSITPIAFIPASATYNVFSSGETASPKGMTPLKCSRHRPASDRSV